MTKKTRRHKRGHEARGVPHTVDLAIIYAGGLDRDRDRAISAVLGKYGTGSGYSFTDDRRDVTATVPLKDLPRVVRALKKLPEIEIKKRVVEWVVV